MEMNFEMDLGGGAEVPLGWLFDNAEFAVSAESACSEAVIRDSQAAVAEGFYAGSVEGYRQGSILDPPARNHVPPNVDFFNNLETHFMAMGGEDGMLLGEDNAEGDSSSWDSPVDFRHPFLTGEFPGTTDHLRIQDYAFDVPVPPDQVGHPPSESSTVRRHVGGYIGPDAFQLPSLARCRSRKFSAKSQMWRQSFANDLDMAKHSNQRKISNSPLAEQQIKEAYFQLEMNYRFKPQLTKIQLQALAVLVELPFDEVSAFYEQKQFQPLSIVPGSSQPNYGQGMRHLNPAKRHRGSDTSSSFELVHSAYGPSRSDSIASLPTSERSAIPRNLSFSRQIRELSQKIYECTWPNCQMSFASKSDWKRHEEVHCPQWYWVCKFEIWPQSQSSEAVLCMREFKRSDHLREHLKKDHKCADLLKVEAGRQRLIPQNPFNKQCGFCGLITADWAGRINHIAEHFKSGKAMSEWKDPWPEDEFEERFDPSDDDDNNEDNNEDNNDLGNKDGNNKSDSTSHKQNETDDKPGSGNTKGGNKETSNGGLHGGSNMRMRPGSFGVKYLASNRGTNLTENVTPRNNDSARQDPEGSSSLWAKMCSLLKSKKGEREISSSPSVLPTKVASFEESTANEPQDQERIDFYCILCLKLVPIDPSLPHPDESYCNCSEAAIREHIMSLTNMHPDVSQHRNGASHRDPEQQLKKKELGVADPESAEEGKFQKSSDTHGAETLLGTEEKKPQPQPQPQPIEIKGKSYHKAAVDTQDETLSFSMRRFLKARQTLEASRVDREGFISHRIYPVSTTRPFRCRHPDCKSREFRTLGSKQRHERELHNPDRSCRHCDFTARNSYHLYEHVEAVHPEQQASKTVGISVSWPFRATSVVATTATIPPIETPSTDDNSLGAGSLQVSSNSNSNSNSNNSSSMTSATWARSIALPHRSLNFNTVEGLRPEVVQGVDQRHRPSSYGGGGGGVDVGVGASAISHTALMGRGGG